jgi:hypothetical protein
MMGVVVGSQDRDWLCLNSWSDQANFGDSPPILGGQIAKVRTTSLDKPAAL